MDKREFFEFLRDEIIEAMPEFENAQFFTREVKKRTITEYTTH